MFSARVAQKPTMAVSDGTKKRKNSAPVVKRLGRSRIGPRPPARTIAQARSASAGHQQERRRPGLEEA